MKEKMKFEPLFILMRGQISVVTTAHGKRFVNHTLNVGDAFGYSDLLRVRGPEFLGYLECSSPDCVVMVIEKPDSVLDLFERKILHDSAIDDYEDLWKLTELRHDLKHLT
jgi:hypothetical protein